MNSEFEWIKGVEEKLRDLRLKMIFSAKESIFKAFFPIVQRYFGFQDVELCWHEVEKKFRGTLLNPLSIYPKGYTVTVGCRIFDEYIVSTMSLIHFFGVNL